MSELLRNITSADIWRFNLKNASTLSPEQFKKISSCHSKKMDEVEKTSLTILEWRIRCL